MENLPPSKDANTEAKFWDDLGLKYEEAFVQDIGLYKIVQTWLNLLPLDARVLDCGCGTGKPVADLIAKSGRHIHGIDFSEGMVELSRKQVPEGSFERASMLDYDPTLEFDGVVANLSLFQLRREEFTWMAQNLFRWLKPGGFLLIGTVAADDVEHITPEMIDSDGKCASGIEWKFMGSVVLVQLLTKFGWKAVLEEAGFALVRTETDVFYPGGDCDREPRYYIIAKKQSE
ncbi:hypothetical protein MMC28_011067 [Mycoblastus sanguinarius]|nr:hypothetical protein [Mycoblastus sanguinarius]